MNECMDDGWIDGGTRFQNVQQFRERTVLGHNLHLMAPLELIAAGLCTIVGRASFMFLVPGPHLDPTG